MASIKCPNCGKDADGKFCADCGAVLRAETCGACGNQIPEGGRFCNMCGVPVAAGRSRPDENGRQRFVPWAIGGAAVVVLAIALILPQLGGDEQPAFTPAAPVAQQQPQAPPTGAAAVDLSSMTPAEAAERLYDRVMQAVTAGDSTQARQFVPMALAAYQRIEVPDVDARYHVATLLLVADEAEVSLRTANTILAQNPDHLLGLFAAAEAERVAGNEAAAREFYAHFLEVYDEELGQGREEYTAHAPGFPAMREQAESYVAQQ